MENVRVLLLAANPESKNLRLGAEHRGIVERVEVSEQERQRCRPGARLTPIEFTQVGATRIRDLSRMLRLHTPHALHFSGHGTPAGELVFETDAGQRVSVAPETTASLLRPFRATLRLVLLNACYSQSQAEALSQSIDCCIGMSRAVEDAVALTFAQAFYELLALGSSIGESFELACQELGTLSADRGWASVPRLLTREGVAADRLFLLPEGPERSGEGFPSTQSEPEAPASQTGPHATITWLSGFTIEKLRKSQLRRSMHELLVSDAELTAFLQSRYPRLARQIGDNMQRETKLNILFTHEPDLPRLRRNLIEFCLDHL